MTKPEKEEEELLVTLWLFYIVWFSLNCRWCLGLDVPLMTRFVSATWTAFTLIALVFCQYMLFSFLEKMYTPVLCKRHGHVLKALSRDLHYVWSGKKFVANTVVNDCVLLVYENGKEQMVPIHQFWYLVKYKNILVYEGPIPTPKPPSQGFYR